MPRKYISQTIKKTVAANQQWRCNICKNILEETFETDHIIPLMNGGTNEQSNLQSLCPNCHRKKTLHEKPAAKKPAVKKPAPNKSPTKKLPISETDIMFQSMFGQPRPAAKKPAVKKPATNKSPAKKQPISETDVMYQSIFGEPSPAINKKIV